MTKDYTLPDLKAMAELNTIARHIYSDKYCQRICIYIYIILRTRE